MPHRTPVVSIELIAASFDSISGSTPADREQFPDRSGRNSLLLPDASVKF